MENQENQEPVGGKRAVNFEEPLKIKIDFEIRVLEDMVNEFDGIEMTLFSQLNSKAQTKSVLQFSGIAVEDSPNFIDSFKLAIQNTIGKTVFDWQKEVGLLDVGDDLEMEVFIPNY
jgi:hypothetical protein